MAKNYTIAEAVQVIAKNEDKEAITDIGRRYPLLLASVTRNVVKGGQDFVEFMNNMPEYLTANKVNSALKAAIENTDDEDDEPKKAEDKSVKKSAAKTTKTSDDEDDDEDEGTDYESMNGKQLWALLGERGLRKTAKSTKKADMIAALKAADEAGEDEADDEVNPYEGKTAMELFKECKARGLKVKPKQKAKTYVDALIADDAANTSDAEDEDDWDDEEEAEAPKKEKKTASKKSTKSNTKSTKKAAKKAELDDDDDDDDDDDWDI